MVTAHRAALESLWDGVCDVFEYEKTKDPVTKRMVMSEVKKLEGIKCRPSYESITAAGTADPGEPIQVVTKLILGSEHVIRPGSKIVVTHRGRTTEYSNSGVVALYSSHQEIILKLFKGWA